MKKSILFLTLLLSMYSCDSDDKSNNSNKTQINLVTGIAVLSDEFSESLIFGNPNNLIKNAIVYPNPAINTIVVSSNFNEISNYWIVKGTVKRNYQNIDFSSILNTSLYTDADLDSNSILKGSNLSSSNLVINIEDLEIGYYKLFFRVNDDLEWFNFHKGRIEIDELKGFWDK